jgi:hypothetical protein
MVEPVHDNSSPGIANGEVPTGWAEGKAMDVMQGTL